jgi:hypothetical protein
MSNWFWKGDFKFLSQKAKPNWSEKRGLDHWFSHFLSGVTFGKLWKVLGPVSSFSQDGELYLSQVHGQDLIVYVKY